MTYKVTFVNKANSLTQTHIEAEDMFSAIRKFIHEYFYIEITKCELLTQLDT